jgi:glycosyltransferase involved in cell wall biosynthesis
MSGFDVQHRDEIIARLRERGPAVILGNPHSHFVKQLGLYWKSLGLDVHVVSTGPNLPTSDEVGLTVHDSISARPLWSRLLRPVNVLLRPLERQLPRWYLQRYRERTGRDHADPWESSWVDHFWDSFSKARVARELKPAFVFGQEATGFALATGLCQGIPRIMFPWGGDIYLSCECSPPIAGMIRAGFQRVDRIVPAADLAAERIVSRFGIPAEKVVPLSWGVELSQFHALAGEVRAVVRARWGIPTQSAVIVNTRRFAPVWGCHAALAGCLEAARLDPNVFCVFLNGGNDPALIESARAQVSTARLQNQFLILDRTISLSEFAELMNVADVALSLMTLGDMRSSSVLQAAAGGGSPILSRHAEYERIAADGFAARFVEPDDHAGLVQTIRELIAAPAERLRIAAQNRTYLAEHEDYPTQMFKLLQLIDGVCANYA